VGTLVLTNFGDRDRLRIDGVPVGREIADMMPLEHHEGSCVVVVATDAPLLPHQLSRVARRAGMGLAATGSHASNGSGEQMLALSTANRLDDLAPVLDVRAVADGPLRDPSVLSAVFRATVEATEEAVVNALVAAEDSVGRDGHTYFAMPIDRVFDVLERAGRLSS
jgi:D-aminopeptidase